LSKTSVLETQSRETKSKLVNRVKLINVHTYIPLKKK